MRDLCRDSSFLAVNVAIFLGGALELGLAQWLPAYAEMSLGFSKWTGSISLLAFSAALALGRIFAGVIGRRVDPIKLMLNCCWTSVVLFLLACFAPWREVALAASVAVGLAGSCLWPTTLGVAADRFPRGGASMFGLLAAFGNLGGILMPWAVLIPIEKTHPCWNSPPCLTSPQFSRGCHVHWSDCLNRRRVGDYPLHTVQGRATLVGWRCVM